MAFCLLRSPILAYYILSLKWALDTKNMEQSITLNLPYDLSDSEWEKVTRVYEGMDGWLGNSEEAFWYGNSPGAPFIYVSSEPSGLVVIGSVEEHLWLGWVSKLCARLTIALGREIYDAEM